MCPVLQALSGLIFLSKPAFLSKLQKYLFIQISRIYLRKNVGNKWLASGDRIMLDMALHLRGHLFEFGTQLSIQRMKSVFGQCISREKLP